MNTKLKTFQLFAGNLTQTYIKKCCLANLTFFSFLYVRECRLGLYDYGLIGFSWFLISFSEENKKSRRLI